jgi:outer membrane protein assembly factor BamC
VNFRPLSFPPGLAVAALLALGGCSSTDGLLSGEKVDYQSQGAKVAPLDVPPDLTQLARDSRYQPQSGVVTASGIQSAKTVAPATPATAASATAAPAAVGDMRVERQGDQRWLVTSQTPEQLWPLLRAFWAERGFTLVVDDPVTGVMETDWAENRGKIPMDALRRGLGFLLESLYSTGERDKFRTRVERTPSGSEVFISHRGLEEILTGMQRDVANWRFRPTDPQLEAEMLTRLMVRMGVKEETARTQVGSTAVPPARARTLTGRDGAAMEFDETFDRAWRRVGLALDRSGFTVEDRDRASGLYFVRYVDPKLAGKEDPNFFAKLFSADSPASASVQRYRIVLKPAGDKTQISILNSQGTPEASDTGNRIVALLVDQLK